MTVKSKDARGAAPEQGFTLLELLLALSLMAVLITLIFSAFHMGSRAWEKGEKLMGDQQILRVVPELIRRQLASFSTPDIIEEDGQWIYLRGDSKSLDFFSSSSLYPESEAGIVYVQYRVQEDGDEREKISFYERDVNYLDVTKISEIDEGSYLDLWSGYTSMAFSFKMAVGSDDEGGEWSSSWKPAESEGLPSAIKITFKKEKSGSDKVVIIPILLGEGEKQQND